MPERASVRRARRSAGWSLVWTVGVNLVIALAPGAALAQAAVKGGRATLRWTPSSGPVAGYLVSVARNGGELRPEAAVTQNEVTLTGVPGDVVIVSVRAYAQPSSASGAYVWSAPSTSSEPIRFEAPGIPAVGLGVFGNGELRAFPSGALLRQLAVPAGGTWSLVHLGRFGREGMPQALFREQATGALWIGDFGRDNLLPHASHFEPGFERRWPSRPADLDQDGVEEILLQDVDDHGVEVWGLVDGALVRHARFVVEPAARLIDAADLDGDGQGDLWFQTSDGLAIVRTRFFAELGTLRLDPPLVGFYALELADYDGDGRSDVLWRQINGKLAISLLRGQPADPEFQIRAVEAREDDFAALPRMSLDLDDVPGAEILLQHTSTGAIDVLFPADPIPGRRRVRLAVSNANSPLIQVAR